MSFSRIMMYYSLCQFDDLIHLLVITGASPSTEHISIAPLIAHLTMMYISFTEHSAALPRQPCITNVDTVDCSITVMQ